jgi:hypothetical protein
MYASVVFGVSVLTPRDLHLSIVFVYFWQKENGQKLFLLYFTEFDYKCQPAL